MGCCRPNFAFLPSLKIGLFFVETEHLSDCSKPHISLAWLFIFWFHDQIVFSFHVSQQCLAGNAKNAWMRSPNSAKTTFFLHVQKPIYPELLFFSSPFKIITHEHSKKKYTFSPAELSSERGEKEVLADSNQPTAPPSTKSHVSYCAARARRREKMAAEGTSSTTGWSLLQSVLVSAVDSCHCPHPSHPSTALLPIAPLSLRPGLMYSKMWLCELYIICYQF